MGVGPTLDCVTMAAVFPVPTRLGRVPAGLGRPALLGIPVLPVLLLAATLLGGLIAARSMVDEVADSGAPVVLAGLLLTLLPGMACGQVLGVRATHALDAFARAFMLSMGVSLPLALAAFFLHLTIGTWVGAMLLWNAVWLIVWLAWPTARFRSGLISDAWHSLVGPDWPFTLALLASLFFLSRGLFRWADSPDAVGWEVGVQLSYVRQYASRLPLDFQACLLRPEPGLALPNLFFLWEFMLAGIARLSGIDPLIAATRSRWLVPVLGVSAFFFMTLKLLRGVEAAKRSVAVTMVAVLTQFLFLIPAPLVYTGTNGPDRGVSAFWGTIHHSDTAMDVLLPLLVGSLFTFLRSGRARHLLALAGLLTVSFFWHPREYFQVMWYGAVALPVGLLLTRFWARESCRFWLRRAVPMAVSFALIAYGLFVVSQSLLPRADTVRSEMVVKQQYFTKLADPAVLGGAYEWFNTPFQGYGAPLPRDPYVFSWLVLAALLLPLVALIGSRAERWLGVYFVTLWWLTLCWFASQVLLLTLSYSEILVTSMRLIYLFAYVMIGAGCAALVRLVRGLLLRVAPGFATAGVLLMSLALGYAFARVWDSGVPGFSRLRAVLETLVPMAALACALALNRRVQRVVGARSRIIPTLPARHSWLVPASAALLMLPATRLQAAALLSDLWTRRGSPEALLDAGNPTGLSPKAISFLRQTLPPRIHLLVDPLGTHLVGIYAPLYIQPYPRGYILADLKEQQIAREGRHPIFKPNAALPEREEAETFLRQHGVDFVLASGEYAVSLSHLAEQNPDLLQVVFREVQARNTILKVLAPATSTKKAPE